MGKFWYNYVPFHVGKRIKPQKMFMSYFLEFINILPCKRKGFVSPQIIFSWIIWVDPMEAEETKMGKREEEYPVLA